MQLEMFEAETEAGIYAAPKPKEPTALESANLRPLLEQFWPMLNERELFKQIWTWQSEQGTQWSALTNSYVLLAIRGKHTQAVPFPPDDLAEGVRFRRGYVEGQAVPERASRINFAALREWAKPAQWPTTCLRCEGSGWAVCVCNGFGECQECSGNGDTVCPLCDQNGIVLPRRAQRLEKTMINANLLACALDILAPAVAPAQNLWMWRDENGGRPAIRFESSEWRLMVMAQQSELKS